MITIAPCAASTRVAATFPIRHLCPFVDEVDDGTVEITWDTRGATLELHALGELVASFRDQVVSHEVLTARLADELNEHPGLTVVQVVTRWTTAGAEVVCRALHGERLIGAGA